MDCTFCLDCLHACPHENVSLLASLPGSQLVRIERGRKRPHRLFRRFDVAVLIFLLVFAAFVSAGGMVEPVQAWERSLRDSFALSSTQPVVVCLYLLTMLFLPTLLVGLCARLNGIFGRVPAGWRESVSTFAPAFVPLGFSMWLIHFSYHLLTGGRAGLPVFQRAATDAGISIFGAPDWSLASTMLSLDWLPSLELLVLGIGLLFTLYVGWRSASRFRLGFARTLGLLAPWAILALVLYTAGVWVIFQPMQMRGMMMMHEMN